MTTDTFDDPIRRQMADRGYTLVPRLTHRYAGENLAVCGAEVPDPCPKCAAGAEVWDKLLADPKFVASLEAGRADIAAGLVVEWDAVRARLTAQPEVEALEAIRDLYTNDNIRPGTFARRAGEIAVAALNRLDRQETPDNPYDSEAQRDEYAALDRLDRDPDTRSADVQATIYELARGALDNYTNLRDNGWLVEPMPNEAEVRAALDRLGR